jgi:hypothetical protein
MISRIWPTEKDARGVPKELIGPQFKIDSAEMILHIWITRTNNGDEKVRYAYTPGSDVRFMTDEKDQTLSIKLSSIEQHQGEPRFHIIGHSMRDTEFSRGAVGKKQGTPLPSHPAGKPNKFPLGNKDDVSTVDADEIVIGLSLKQHLDSTYINIIVLDRKTGAIIDCDPQVENGTKTAAK